MKLKLLIAIVLFICTSVAFASGISLGSTRVVYMADNKQVSLSVNNSNREAAFMLQGWIENAQGKQTNDFIITPPLFMIKPNQENILRIMLSGAALPMDRESVYWINIKAIPPKPKDNQGKNTLQLAVLNKIKLFYRPNGLTIKPEVAFASLEINKGTSSVNVKNPTPYHITMVNVKINGKSIEGEMIEPFSSTVLKTDSKVSSFSYQTINDYGALSVMNEF